MCTCSIFVCRHKNNDMSTLLGHAHTYIPTDRQSDTQAYIHKSIQTYSYTYTWLHMCDVSPLWGGGWGGTRGGWIIYTYIIYVTSTCMNLKKTFPFSRGSLVMMFQTSCKKNIKIVKHEFISGLRSRHLENFPSLRFLADYKLSGASLRPRCVRKGWVADRSLVH